MADYLKVITPHLHPDLISPEAMSRLQELAQTLPPFADAMLEFRLGAGQSHVDLSVFFPRRIPNLPEKFLTHPAWQAVQDFCQEWVDQASFLYEGVTNVGLEFDLDQPLSEIPIPCIFVSWDKKAVSDAQVLREIVPRLLNDRLSSQLKLNLQCCVDALPEGSRIGFLGIMLSRSTQAVRLIMENIPLQKLPDYLRQIGWSESTDNFSTFVSDFSEFKENISLFSFDVGDIIFPRIGIEFYPKKQPKSEPQWQLFLDYLIEIELCTPAKKQALLAWHGFSTKADEPELWPKDLLGGDLFLSSKAVSAFWRTLNHIKIVYEPGSSLEAKGYLLSMHDWWMPAAETVKQ